MALSPDGTCLASSSSSYNNTVQLWDTASGLAVGEPLCGHSNSVNSVAFSPDGTRLASGSHDNTVRLWDTVSGRTAGELLRCHTYSVNSVAFSPDGTSLASGSYAKTVRLWDGSTQVSTHLVDRISSNQKDRILPLMGAFVILPFWKKIFEI